MGNPQHALDQIQSRCLPAYRARYRNIVRLLGGDDELRKELMAGERGEVRVVSPGGQLILNTTGFPVTFVQSGSSSDWQGMWHLDVVEGRIERILQREQVRGAGPIDRRKTWVRVAQAAHVANAHAKVDLVATCVVAELQVMPGARMSGEKLYELTLPMIVKVYGKAGDLKWFKQLLVGMVQTGSINEVERGDSTLYWVEE